MNENDYLDKATEKIKGKKKRQAVYNELLDHFELKINRFEKIGFNQNISESKTLKAMGDADTVAEQFAMLHNEFYNPVFDVVFLFGALCWQAHITF